MNAGPVSQTVAQHVTNIGWLLWSVQTVSTPHLIIERTLVFSYHRQIYWKHVMIILASMAQFKIVTEIQNGHQNKFPDKLS